MKWLYGTLALLAIILVGFWLFAETPKDIAIDPNHPWQHKAAEAVEETQKDEAKADPRKVDDVILQKDYCAAGQYFTGGRNQKHVAHFLDLMLEGEAGKTIPPDDKLILQALLSKDFDYSVKKLKEAKSWQGKMILGMVLSGTVFHPHPFRGRQATQEELQEALLALDQAEDMNWDNGFIPLYRYLVMKKKDGDGPGLKQFLKDELSRRKNMENPFGASLVSFARLRAQDPMFYSLSLWQERILSGSVVDATDELEHAAMSDPELARSTLRLADTWQRKSLPMVNEGYGHPFVPFLDPEISTALGAELWPKVYPNQPIPDRYRDPPEHISRRMRDRNPSETDEFGWLTGYGKECGPKWKEAVDNDYALLRDRLQKWDELQRATKR